MTKHRIGIIGTGFIAGLKHIPSLAYFPDRAEIAALCDKVIDRAAEKQATHGLKGAYLTDDYHRVVEDPDIDIVHVCTPNNTHRELTVAALEAGKHVLCEKPIAITGEDARAMVDAARANNRKLTIGYQNRFRRDSRWIRATVDAGELGEIYVARAYAMRRRGVPTWGVFTDKEQQGGGPLIDLGGHALDLALWYMGNYEVDYVVGQTFDKMREQTSGNLGGPWDPSTLTVEDSAFGFVRMKNGALVTIDASWALNIPRNREGCVTLCGTGGGIDVTAEGVDFTPTLNKVTGGELGEFTPEAKSAYFGVASVAENPGALEIKHWLDAIDNDADPAVLPEQACRVTEILEAVYQSAASGEPVKF